ncbi:MAG: hypothetical protein WC622_08440 [Pedobacter sp.]|jgi:hypothetical protein|uniref:hypothetical protein n=1 Tax=Pedobacter sp. TaxID=1411316 RepID=UPI00356B0745
MKIRLLFIALLLGLSLGCKKSVPFVSNIDTSLHKELGKNLKNPYSVTNMRSAYASLITNNTHLSSRDRTLSSIQGTKLSLESTQLLQSSNVISAVQGTAISKEAITASHYYIKFKPKTLKEYDLLKADSSLVIYPFPIDSETNNYHANYHDPSLPANVPTYQYASVPINHKLPNIEYEKLEDLFLPNEQKPNSTIATIKVKDLVDKSYAQLMLPDPGDDGGGGGGGGYPPSDPYRNGDDWRPNGRITMYDEVLGTTIGVEGLKVRARRWFTTYDGITDANGYYAVDGWFSNPANYWLDFERYDFAIIDFVHQSNIELSGPKIEASWNVDFTGFHKYCATIFRAAFHYYYKDIHGLRRPPQNSFWARQLKITALNVTSNPSGITNPIHTWFGINDLVTIATLAKSTEYTYSTTIHELAHAAHWDNSNLSFALSASTATESWAAGVEWYLTRMEYPNHLGTYWPLGGNYRNVVMDLIDDASQISYFDRQQYSGFYNNFGFGAPNDQVEGYNIVDIQNALINNPTTWNEWKTNIKNNYNNATEQHVDAVFDAWLSY